MTNIRVTALVLGGFALEAKDVVIHLLREHNVLTAELYDFNHAVALTNLLEIYIDFNGNSMQLQYMEKISL